MTKNEVIEVFEKTNALLNGHFLLTSGKHSNQYFQCAQVLQHPEHTTAICGIIADHFKNKEIDVVVAPAMGGIIVGQEVARQLNKRFVFVERKEKDLELRRNFEIKPGEKVLVCEDVVTTGGSVVETINIVKQEGGNLVGVGVIVDRSNGKVDFGVDQVSTLQLEVVTYESDNCPICSDGEIPLVKPGSRK